METAKRGRPVSGKAMTPAQRQQASRAKRRSERYGTSNARQVNFLLSAKAIQALDKLTSYRDKSQKEVIEELLIQAYGKQEHTDLNK